MLLELSNNREQMEAIMADHEKAKILILDTQDNIADHLENRADEPPSKCGSYVGSEAGSETQKLPSQVKGATKVTNPKDGQVKAEMVEESLEERPLVNQQDQEDESSQEEDDLDDQEDEDVPDEVQIKKKVATLRVNQEKVQYAEESKIREAQETLQRIKFETQLRKGLKLDMKTPTSQQNINKTVLIPKNTSTPKHPSKSVYQNSESGISTSSRESEPPLQKILKSLKKQKYTEAKPTTTHELPTR
jgi:hypothetical protein